MRMYLLQLQRRPKPKFERRRESVVVPRFEGTHAHETQNTARTSFSALNVISIISPRSPVEVAAPVARTWSAKKSRPLKRTGTGRAAAARPCMAASRPNHQLQVQDVCLPLPRSSRDRTQQSSTQRTRHAQMCDGNSCVRVTCCAKRRAGACAHDPENDRDTDTLRPAACSIAISGRGGDERNWGTQPPATPASSRRICVLNARPLSVKLANRAASE